MIELRCLPHSVRTQLEASGSFPPFFISVSGWRMNGNVVFYSLKCGLQLEDSAVCNEKSCRFSELLSFHEAMESVLQNSGAGLKFPGKSLFKSKDLGFIRNRLADLQSYFSKLTAIPNILRSPELQSFINYAQLKRAWDENSSKYQCPLM